MNHPGFLDSVCYFPIREKANSLAHPVADYCIQLGRTTGRCKAGCVVDKYFPAGKRRFEVKLDFRFSQVERFAATDRE